jgi:hypothetical protein
LILRNFVLNREPTIAAIDVRVSALSVVFIAQVMKVVGKSRSCVLIFFICESLHRQVVSVC